MNRIEEIDAELEQLRDRLCCAEDVDCSCGGDIRAQIHTLIAEQDDIPRPRAAGTGRDSQPARQP